MPPQPSLAQLTVFAAVARLRSFQRAGAETGMSTSAVSHAIRGLEERLGVSLFNRTTRSVALTEAGQHLLERLTPILRDIDGAFEELNNFRETPTGTLRLNASRPASHLLLAPLVPRFLAAYPDLHVEIVSDDGLVDIVQRGFDAGIRFEELVPEDMVAVRIGRDLRMIIVGAPDYLERRGVPHEPEDLRAHDCICYRFTSGRTYRWELEKDGVKREMDVSGPITLSDQEMMVRMAVAGLGLAFVFEDSARSALDDGRLVTVMEEWCPPFAAFLYYPRQRRVSAALRAFIDMAKAARTA